MAPTLQTPQGGKITTSEHDRDEINARFAATMNADDGQDDEQPPPRRSASRPASPPADETEAPKRSRGRPRKDPAEKSRTTDKPAEPVKDDYTEDAQSTIGGLWVVAASISFTQPYALVLDANSDALVSALAEGAKHNSTVRRFIGAGGNTWMLQLASVGLSIGVQSIQLMGDAELREKARTATKAKLKGMMKEQGIDVPEAAAADGAAAA